MSRERIGTLPPRYSFLLNPYTVQRLSKCPLCRGFTHLRKFALCIHVEGWGPMVLGKTCRYCTPCELIMAHANELEAELANSPAKLAPARPGKGYLVLGTMERKEWQNALKGSGAKLHDMLQHMADFKKHFDLHVDPGGWGPAPEPPR